MKSTIQLLSFAAVFISAIGISSCGGGNKRAELENLRKQQDEIASRIRDLEAELGPDSTASGGKVADVLVTEVVPGPFAHYIEVQATVEADEAVDVRPTMAGTVTRILVREGDQVKAGQILAETDNDIYVRQLNSLKPQLELAKELFARQSRLWEQKIGSEVQYLQAKTQKESIEKQIETLEEQIDLTRIKSPINGTVDMVSLKTGQLAAASLIEPAFRIVNLSSLKATAEMAESNSGKVRQGNSVKLFFPDLNEEVDSRISFTARTIDPMTRTFEVQATLGNNPAYRPNMVAVMKVLDYQAEEAVSIPLNLIQTSGSEPYVYVAQTGADGQAAAHRRIIRTGQSYGHLVEVLSGLMPGDRLITTGYADLTEGMKLNIR